MLIDVFINFPEDERIEILITNASIKITLSLLTLQDSTKLANTQAYSE